MNLSDPMSSVVPTAHGAVLAVLARTDRPLSGRQLADLSGGRVKQSRAHEVLHELTEAGVALCEERPPAKLYRLNRDHVAAAGIVALASQRDELLRRIRDHVERWMPRPVAVWLFGSAARGEGGPRSDIDLLVVRPDAVADDDQQWLDQVSDLAARVWGWSGNGCEVFEVSSTELTDMITRGEPLIGQLRTDAVGMAGRPPRSLLKLGAKR